MHAFLQRAERCGDRAVVECLSRRFGIVHEIEITDGARGTERECRAVGKNRFHDQSLRFRKKGLSDRLFEDCMQYTRIHTICQYIGKRAFLSVFLSVFIIGAFYAHAEENKSLPEDPEDIALYDAIKMAMKASIQKIKDAALAEVVAQDKKMSEEDKTRAAKIIDDSINHAKKIITTRIIEACDNFVFGVNACPASSLEDTQKEITAMIVAAFNAGHAQGSEDIEEVAKITKAHLTRDLAAKKLEEYAKFVNENNIDDIVNSKRQILAIIIPKITEKIQEKEKELAKGQAAVGGFWAGVGKFWGFWDVEQEVRNGIPRLALFQTTLGLLMDLNEKMKWINEANIQLRKDMTAIQEALAKPSLSPKEIKDVFARIDRISISLMAMQNSLDQIVAIVNRGEITDALKDPEAKAIMDEYNKERRAKKEPVFDWGKLKTEVAQLEQAVNQDIDIKGKIAFLNSDAMKDLREKLRAALAVPDINIKKSIVFPLLSPLPSNPSPETPKIPPKPKYEFTPNRRSASSVRPPADAPPASPRTQGERPLQSPPNATTQKADYDN